MTLCVCIVLGCSYSYLKEIHWNHSMISASNVFWMSFILGILGRCTISVQCINRVIRGNVPGIGIWSSEQYDLGMATSKCYIRLLWRLLWAILGKSTTSLHGVIKWLWIIFQKHNRQDNHKLPVFEWVLFSNATSELYVNYCGISWG